MTRKMNLNPQPLQTVPVRGQVPVGTSEIIIRCADCKNIRVFCECDEFKPDRSRWPR